MKKASGKSNLQIVNDYLNGTRPFTQVGWSPDLEQKKNGEIWDDAQGNRWVQKNGYKKRVNKGGGLLELTKQECSVCKMNIKLFGKGADSKVFFKTGRCYDCEVQYELKKQTNINYQNEEKIRTFGSQKKFCIDLEKQLLESIEYLENKSNKITFHNEDGSEEFWTDTMKENLLESAKIDLKECRDAMIRIDERLTELGVKQ